MTLTTTNDYAVIEPIHSKLCMARKAPPFQSRHTVCAIRRDKPLGWQLTFFFLSCGPRGHMALNMCSSLTMKTTCNNDEHSCCKSCCMVILLLEPHCNPCHTEVPQRPPAFVSCLMTAGRMCPNPSTLPTRN